MTEKMRETKERGIWTPANIVTLVRICLVPVFVIIVLSPWPEWFGIHDIVTNKIKAYIATGVFIIISCTDWIDGYLARSRNEVTDFGKFLDPLADKILVAAALIALVELDVIPSWPVLIILIREFIVSGIRMVAATKGVVIAASWYGKAKTVFQIIAIVLFLLKDHMYTATIESVVTNPQYIISWTVMIIALVLTVLSMLDYIAKSRPLLFPKKSHDAQKTQEVCASEAATEMSAPCDSADIVGLTQRVIDTARAHEVTLGTAESLTGGMISCALTSIAGSSACFLGGVASYALSVKHDVLKVNEHLLETEGAVNEQCAREMAEGATRELGVDIAVAVTGIAGPSGDEPGKPVGTVFIATCAQGLTEVKRMQYSGTREEIRKATTFDALRALLEQIESLQIKPCEQ